MNGFLNYAVALILGAFSILFFSESITMELHSMVARYGSYVNNINLIITCILIGIGSLLGINALLVANFQACYNHLEHSNIAVHIFVLEILNFLIAGMGSSFFLSFQESTWIRLLFILGISVSVLGFISNRMSNSRIAPEQEYV